MPMRSGRPLCRAGSGTSRLRPSALSATSPSTAHSAAWSLWVETPLFHAQHDHAREAVAPAPGAQLFPQLHGGLFGDWKGGEGSALARLFHMVNNLLHPLKKKL
jgi:hypothetical protein